MSKKSRELLPEDKLGAVKEYLSGKGSTYSIAAKYGVTDTSIRRWVDRYEIEGEQAFRRMPLHSSLSQREKLCAVHEYLDGALSLRDIALKYGVGDTSVRKWIAKYNAGGDATLLPNHTKKHYSDSFKQEVIHAYLTGEGSYSQLCVRYKIPSFDIPRSSYYKWSNRKESKNERFNQQLLPLIKDAYEQKSGILGYRQMTIKLNRENNIHVNQKRIYRLMKILGLKSVCRRKSI